MRCLALGEEWKSLTGERVLFVMSDPDHPIKDRILSSGMDIRVIHHDPGSSDDASETCRIALEHGALWCVVDGYHFKPDYQKAIRDSGLNLLFIDDYGHCDHYYAELILNQNIYAGPEYYPSREINTRLLLGTKYILIRNEFLKYRTYNREIPKTAQHILVTFGGSDPDNISGKMLAALEYIRKPDLEVIAVVGLNNQNYASLQSMAKNSQLSIRILKDARNLPDLMAWADVAISAGGSTTYELAFMALPSLLYPIAQNQVPIVDSFVKQSAAVDLRSCSIHDPDSVAGIIYTIIVSSERRDALCRAMKNIVDGKGAFRVVRAMIGNSICLRPVVASDCTRVWEWINEPDVRSHSFHPNNIPLNEHSVWFSRELADPASRYYIAMQGDEPVGQARFRIEGNEAVISVLLDRRFRGMNKGAELIRYATGKLFNECPVQTINAYVKTGNDASYRSFIRAGFHDSGIIKMHGQDAHHLIFHRGVS